MCAFPKTLMRAGADRYYYLTHLQKQIWRQKPAKSLAPDHTAGEWHDVGHDIYSF